jgi:hypothetical protein
MTENIQCSLAGLRRMTALLAQGRHGFDGVTGSRTSWGWQRRGLREDDSVRKAWGCIGSQAQGGGRGLRDGTCVVVGVTVLGQWRWRRKKGLDCGREWWCRGSGEDSTMAWRLRGGLDNDMGSGELHDGVGSKEIFGGNFWQPNYISGSLRGLGFAKAT